MGQSTTFWVVVVIFFTLNTFSDAADTLDPIGLDQEVSSAALNGLQIDSDHSRSRIAGHAGEDSVSTEAVVDCFQTSSDLTTLLQSDLARVTVELMVDACSNPSSNATTTVSGSTQLALGVERTSRKVISLDYDSNQPISGMVSLQRVGDREPVWELDLSDSPQAIESAFAVELTAGDYLLEVATEQTTRVDHATDLRVSIVNRGDVNGNEQFDAADLAVLDAILNQDTFVATVDLDDDGDNDVNDRRLWTDGLNSPAILTRPLSIDLDDAETLAIFEEPEPMATEEPADEMATDETIAVEESGVLVEATVGRGEEPAIVVASLPPVIGDIDGDGEVNFGDFLQFSESFGSDAELNPAADFDRDGAVDFPDFLIFTREFGNFEPTNVPAPEPTYPAWLPLVVATCWLRSSVRRGT